MCFTACYFGTADAGSIRYECVIFTLFLSIADTEQYFVVDNSIACSISAGSRPSP